MIPDTNKDQDEQDVMEANEILLEIHKLIDKEKGENEPNVVSDISHLEDAADSIQKFIDAEQNESSGTTSDETSDEDTDQAMAQQGAIPGVVNTGLLTGPINGLRSFLVKKQQDIQNQ